MIPKPRVPQGKRRKERLRNLSFLCVLQAPPRPSRHQSSLATYQRGSLDPSWISAVLNRLNLLYSSPMSSTACLRIQPHLDNPAHKNLLGVIRRQTKHVGTDVLPGDMGT